MNIEQTLSAIGRANLSLGVDEDHKLLVSPKQRITPELRAAIKEHKGQITCELMWSSYLTWIAEGADNLPPCSPALREAYGDPHAYADALVDFEVVRKKYGLIRHMLESPDAAAVITKDGIILVASETEENE
jgi:hypothetical protein